MKQMVIVGGGVAGLSALNRLADHGVNATLIEGGNYPSHKVCGEFFSPECLPILSEWGVEPISCIQNISLMTPYKTCQFPLLKSAKSQSRFDFDGRLVNRAKERGARILTNTKVEHIGKNCLSLDNGEVLQYTDLIMSTGRLFGASQPKYVGIKGHLAEVSLEGSLEMYPFPGGYAGLSPIGNGQVNFTTLIKKEDVDMENPILSLFDRAPHLQKRVQEGRLLFKEWMVCQVPAFGLKHPPLWENTYFIGDAAGTIPPASGLGLSLAVISGCIAADYAMKADVAGFRLAWKKEFQSVFYYAHLLHRLFMQPVLVNPLTVLGSYMPRLGAKIFKWTRFQSF